MFRACAALHASSGDRCRRRDGHAGTHEGLHHEWDTETSRPGSARAAGYVDPDGDLLGHLTTLRTNMLERGDTKLTLAVGNEGERVYVAIALDGDAHRLREAISEYLAWPCATWSPA